MFAEEDVSGVDLPRDVLKQDHFRCNFLPGEVTSKCGVLLLELGCGTMLLGTMDLLSPKRRDASHVGTMGHLRICLNPAICWTVVQPAANSDPLMCSRFH